MAVAASAKRYAQAVFQIARELNTLDQWLTDLTELGSLVEAPGFMGVMESPKVPLEKKTEILRERFTAISPLAMNLALLLVAKKRLEILPNLLQEFRHLVDVHRGVEHVLLTTAVPLSPPEQAGLAQQLEQYTGKQVVLTTAVDPAIIGGMIARMGDTLIDGSVKGRLQALRRQLVEAR